MSFSPVFFRLQQEAYIFQSCLATGLREARDANLAEKGRYFTAFFQLSIGAERLAKLDLILDHMASNGLAPPGEAAIKSFGHDITSLYRSAEAVVVRRGYSFAGDFTPSATGGKLLAFLSDFARSTRYANMDALASGKAALADPLAEWKALLTSVIESELSPDKRDDIERMAAEFEEEMGDGVVVVAHDLDATPFKVSSYMAQSNLQAIGARFLVWHLVELLRPLRALLWELGHEAREVNIQQSKAVMHIPDMGDFAQYLLLDKSHVVMADDWPR